MDFIYEFMNQLPLNEYQAVGLIGSYAKNTPSTWSDIDLIIVTEEKKENYVRIHNDKYFSISHYSESDFQRYFREPNLIINAGSALRDIKPLYDPDGMLENIIETSKKFKITSVVKEHCRYKAKNEYIGYIEEAQKAIQGLLDHHIGKMLNGLYGLTYGMFHVLRLMHQIQISSDNDFYDAVIDFLDDKDPIKELAAHAFGILPGTLEDHVEAGLEIFMHIGNNLMDEFSENEKMYVLKLIQEIIKVV